MKGFVSLCRCVSFAPTRLYPIPLAQLHRKAMFLEVRDESKLLKLSRPVHNLAWLLERLEKLCDQLEERQRVEKDLEKRQLLESAAGKVARKCVEIEKLFRAVYRGTKVFQEGQK